MTLLETVDVKARNLSMAGPVLIGLLGVDEYASASACEATMAVLVVSVLIVYISKKSRVGVRWKKCYQEGFTFARVERWRRSSTRLSNPIQS